jgi:hypothetical protein
MKTLAVFIFLGTLVSFSAQTPSIDWENNLGGSSSDDFWSIQKTSEGGYIIGGSTTSNDGDVSGNNGNSDVWVVKLDNGGNIVWQKCLGGSNDDFGRSIQQTSDGGYIVGGRTASNDGDVSGNNGNVDLWVVKLDIDGELVWQKCLGGSDDELGRSVQQTSDGGYIVGGSTASNDGDVSGNNGLTDSWVVKLDNDGELVWQKCLGGSDDEFGSSVQQTSDGGFIVGSLTNSTNGDVSGNNGNRDVWVIKLNNEGDIVWQNCLGGSDDESGGSVQQTSDGGYIVGGSSTSNDGDVSGNNGNRDMWVIKLDNNGGIVWQNSIGGSGNDFGSSVQQTSDGGYIVGGSSSSNDGDVSGNNGNRDVWVIKLGNDGELVWQKCLGGSEEESGGFVLQNSVGDYIVGGSSYSNDGDVSDNNGENDYWVVKLGQIIGTQELIKPELSIYPNPTSERFKLSTKATAIGQRYVIIDQLGKTIVEGRIISTTMDFDISSFPEGVYYLSVQDHIGSVEIVKE